MRPMSALRAGSQVMFNLQFERAEPFTRTVGLSIRPRRGYRKPGGVAVGRQIRFRIGPRCSSSKGGISSGLYQLLSWLKGRTGICLKLFTFTRSLTYTRPQDHHPAYCALLHLRSGSKG